jgi:hypothetical protein
MHTRLSVRIEARNRARLHARAARYASFLGGIARIVHPANLCARRHQDCSTSCLEKRYDVSGKKETPHAFNILATVVADIDWYFFVRFRDRNSARHARAGIPEVRASNRATEKTA